MRAVYLLPCRVARHGNLIAWQGAAEKMMAAVEQFGNRYYFGARGSAVKINNQIVGWNTYVNHFLKPHAPDGGAERSSTWGDPGLGGVDFTNPSNRWHRLATDRGIDVPVELIRTHHGR